MNENMKKAIWEIKLGNFYKKLELDKLQESIKNSAFSNLSDSYKQKLVYDLLEATKNKDQNRFFYLLLKSINKPKENFKEVWEKLEKYYDILPEEAFVNFAYSIIIGIMSTYKGREEK